ncbi:MAG: response regulator [Spirochaetaceae bacterium]|nr:MAG: response regulator [Spirochaetaceae bacterium]
MGSESETHNEDSHTRDGINDPDWVKTDFISNLLQELRIPLALILGPLQSILSGKLGRKVACDDDKLKMMFVNGTKLMKLINNVFDLSRIESGRMSVRKQKVNIPDLLKFCVSIIRYNAENRGLNVVFNDNTSDAGLFAVIDKDLLENAVFNLLSNAINFTGQGGCIIVQLDAAEKEYAITVKDTGVGIPQDRLESVFGRLEQPGSLSAVKHDGAGIGLALTGRIVEILGGRITVKSNVNKGSSFCITLPFGNLDEIIENAEQYGCDIIPAFPEDMALQETINTCTGKHSRQKSKPARSKKILIVENNLDVQIYLTTVLGDLYRTTTVGNGLDCLEKMRSDPPDLVIADVMIPGINGCELTEQIRKNQDFAGIPVLLLASGADSLLKGKGFQSGADDCIMHPFDADELSARVHAHLETKMMRDELSIQKEKNAELFRKNTQVKNVIRESDEKYRRMMDNLPVSVIELDIENRIQYLNHYAKKLFEVSDENLAMGIHLFDYVEPGDREIMLGNIKKLHHGEESRLNEYRLMTRNGNRISALVRSVPRLEHDNVIGIRAAIFELEPNFNVTLLPSGEFCSRFNISEREKEVLVLFMRGYSYNVIAEKLFISYRTVNTHLTNIYHKTGVNSRDQLMELIAKKMM